MPTLKKGDLVRWVQAAKLHPGGVPRDEANWVYGIVLETDVTVYGTTTLVALNESGVKERLIQNLAYLVQSYDACRQPT